MTTNDIRQKAATYWTTERLQQLTGGKKWLLLPNEAPELLQAIGLMNKDASISWDNTRKFSQINHMLQLLENSLLDQVGRQEELNLFDAGCGTSFLSLTMAWYLKHKVKHRFKLVGIDSNKKVIETSKNRAKQLGVEDSSNYVAGLIPTTSTEYFKNEQEKNQRPNILMALHACDTATDYAIALGIKDKADVIAVAPCCQRELSEKMKVDHPIGHPFESVFSSPNIRRDIAANLTDSLRMLHLRSHGYEVTATEFVPSEHTPKNRLLLAIRRGNFHAQSKEQLMRLTEHIGGHTIVLEELLN